MKDILMKIHYTIVSIMADSWVVENLLIAKVKENGKWHDCIYCTILRNAVLFFVLGVVSGYLLAVL